MNSNTDHQPRNDTSAIGCDCSDCRCVECRCGGKGACQCPSATKQG